MRILFAFFVVCSHSLSAQFNQQILFPGDSSFILIQKLVSSYKPSVVLDYSNARVRMYKEIYNESDSVKCVYSGHSLYLDPLSSDPIGYLSKNGNSNGINCEHSFPQSKGADNGNARSDMHHLYPARAAVNEARSNYPFADIKDSQTDVWFYRTIAQNFIPSQDIDVFSESVSGQFEPREQHKGNVARAIFYFFTMYELQADRSFFELMKPYLCQWHLKDPVDSTEWYRTNAIAKYQENKSNPFVLDCSLVRRCYCPGIPDCLLNTNTSSESNDQVFLYPNPVEDQLILRLPAEFQGMISISDQTGKVLQYFEIKNLQDKLSLNVSSLQSGIYILRINSTEHLPVRKRFVKL